MFIAMLLNGRRIHFVLDSAISRRASVKLEYVKEDVLTSMPE
jgi:hypothetical protein